MNVSQPRGSSSGRLVPIVGGEWSGHLGFVPNDLPPTIVWDSHLAVLTSEADRALGTLSGQGENLPNPRLLILPFMRKEAVVSSRIEGTQSTLSDLLRFEATTKEGGTDVREVHNHVRAMAHGLERLATLPLSLRLIREIHSILLEGVRGEKARPGEFRQKPNWIGSDGCTLDEATFVPPPVPEMNESLHELERFMSANISIPPLIKVAMIHYQFEAIHPFLDGNGRIGRLLVVFLLCEQRLLSQPLLYISDFFERHRQEYYDLLLAVSEKGAWRGWVEFFLKAVAEQALDAVSRSRSLVSLQHEYRRLAQDEHLTPSALRLVDCLFEMPILTVPQVQRELGLTWPGAKNVVQSFVDQAILRPVNETSRPRLYVADRILEILD